MRERLRELNIGFESLLGLDIGQIKKLEEQYTDEEKYYTDEEKEKNHL